MASNLTFRPEHFAITGGWLASAEVGRANGNQLDDLAEWPKNKRDAGERLGLWFPAENTW